MKYLKEIRFRLTQEEKSTLIAMSQQKNMSQSTFVRRLIKEQAKKHGLLLNPKGKLMKLSNGGASMNR